MEITAYLPHQVILSCKSVILVRTTKFLQMENQSNWKIVHFINTSHIQRGGGGNGTSPEYYDFVANGLPTASGDRV